MKTKYIKIFSIFIFTFLFSSFLVKNVFLSYTPKIKPQWHKILQAKIFENISKTQLLVNKNINVVYKKGSINNINKNVNFVSNKNSLSSLKQISEKYLFPIQKGIYAAELERGSFILIKENEVEWIEYTFYVNNKEIKIKVPKDEEVPTQETVEALFK